MSRTTLLVVLAGIVILLGSYFPRYENRLKRDQWQYPKADVVMPLLDQITPKDTPESVLTLVYRVFGPCDFQTGSGPMNNYRTAQLYELYELDDGTGIMVNFENNKFVAVRHCTRPQWNVLKDLYHVPKSEAGLK